MGIGQSSQSIDDQANSFHTVQNLKGKRILLAEDCLDQGRLYLNFLQLAGAEVTLECNGKSAFDAVRKSLTLFNAVVMDFQMPEMDGLITTKSLRQIGYSGAIIAVTAIGSDELKQRWFEAGCDAFLQKPLIKRELINAVQLHLTRGANAAI